MRSLNAALLLVLTACAHASGIDVDASTTKTDAGASVDAGIAADAGPSDGGIVTPIQLADRWVAGWYSATSRGINEYAHSNIEGAPDGYYTQWAGDPGVTEFANVTDCSSFSDVLMSRSYNWLPPTAQPRPYATDYYWAVRNGVGFTQITNVAQIASGDAIMLDYGTTDAQGDTGHVAWVDALPQIFSGPPDEPGLTQYSVVVIDSVDGFHGAPVTDVAQQDDRFFGLLLDGGQCATNSDCTSEFGPYTVCDNWQLISESACTYTGVGRGLMRLLADSSGNIAGYMWSINIGSTFYPRPNPLPAPGAAFTGRDIVVGRFAAPDTGH